MRTPTHAIDGEYIKEWLVLGPFFSNDLETDFLADVGSEANIYPKEGDTVTTMEGKQLTWKLYRAEGNIVNLSDAFGRHEYVIAYAACILQSEAGGVVQIHIESDTAVVIWMNGQQAHRFLFNTSLTITVPDVLEADLKEGANLCLVKVHQGVGDWNFAMRPTMLPPTCAVLSGRVTDSTGVPIPTADVRLKRNEDVIAQTWTDATGSYRITVYPVSGRYDLSATSGEKGDWQLGIQLHEWERRTLNLTLREAISIEGTLLTLNDTTPHVAIPVQAIRISERANQRMDELTSQPLHPVRKEAPTDSQSVGEFLTVWVGSEAPPKLSNGVHVSRFTHEVVATTLSDNSGKYRFINLKPGAYQVRCQIMGGYVSYRQSTNEPPITSHQSPISEEVLHVESGKTLTNIDFRFAPFKKGTWKTYTSLDGLGHDWVTDIHYTSDGLLWFSTYGGGVSRFDGKTFQNFTHEDGLAHNDVLAIQSASDGLLWFGTKNGVSCYVRKAHQRQRLMDGKEFIRFTKEEVFLGQEVCTIHNTSDGVLWFGMWRDGLYRYDGKEVVHFTTKDGLSGNRVLAICQDASGVMWFGTNGGVSRYDGKSFVTITTKDGLAHNHVWAIHCDADGVLWFGTNRGVCRGVYPEERRDGKSFVTLTTKDGLLSNFVRAIYRDPDGVMWFGLWQGGASRYDGKTFVNFTSADGLASNWVNAIHQTPDGLMWFGTGDFKTKGGVSVYDEEAFFNLTPKDGLAGHTVNTICRAKDGDLWFGTYLGVSRYDGKSFVTFTTKDGLAQNAVNAISCVSDGTVWFGTGNFTDSGGVSRYDGKEFVTLTTKDGLANYFVTSIYSAPDGVLWFGTWEGGVSRGVYPESFGSAQDKLRRRDGKRFTNFTTKDGLAHNRITSIYGAPDGVLWFGTWEGGVSRAVYPELSRRDGKTFVNFTTKDGLAHNVVHAIHRTKDGVMWFGTNGGVSRYDGEHFVTFTTKDGLANNEVWAIHAPTDDIPSPLIKGGRGVVGKGSEEECICFGTWGGGVSMFDGIAWMSLDTLDGLAGNTVYSIHQDSDSTLWFGTEGGITRYRRSTVPPRARIVAVTTDQRYTDLDALGPVIQGTRITFEYNSIDFKTHPQKRLYRYKLEGYNADWNPPTRETQVDYANLPLGEYTFHVQAIDRDLNYSEPATLKITVQPDPRNVTVAVLQTEVNRLRREVSGKYEFGNIIGRSEAMEQVFVLMERAIESELTVLIQGETGTGKELIAKAIHYNSPRQQGPFIALNCGAFPETLVESELFGHERGAFTGAVTTQKGKLELAYGGTLLLDEIGEMPPSIQVKLLRVLDEQRFMRVGGAKQLEMNARILVATNRDIELLTRQGKFREDLFYRLNVIRIQVPPLRERREDIPLLVDSFLKELAGEQTQLAPGVMEYLINQPWRGNARELRHAVERAVVVSYGKLITLEDFLLPSFEQATLDVPSTTGLERGEVSPEALFFRTLLEKGKQQNLLEIAEEIVIRAAVDSVKGNKSQAAKLLRVDRKKIERRMAKYKDDVKRDA